MSAMDRRFSRAPILMIEDRGMLRPVRQGITGLRCRPTLGLKRAAGGFLERHG